MGQMDLPQQQNRDVQNQTATRPDAATGNLQADAYNRVTQSEQAIQKDLQNVLGHLQNAETLVEQRGPQAANQEYQAAMRAAQGIDQNAVAQERALVKQQLQQQNLDPQLRKALMQEDADLHTLQRAPGFAMANFALLNLRNGNQEQGIQLLLEAEKRDPEMSSDPNFQRHLKSALDAGKQLSGQPASLDTNGQVLQPGQQQGQLDARTGQIAQPGQQAQPGQMSQLDAQGHSPVESAQALLGQQMTPQLQQQWIQAIQNADAGQSPKLAALQQQEQTALNSLKQSMTPQMQQAIQAEQQAAQAEIGKLPQAQQQQAATLHNAMDTATTMQDRAAAQAAFLKMVPSMQAAEQQRDQALGPQTIQNIVNLSAIHSQADAENNQSAVTRFMFAQALHQSGDDADAKTIMAQAMQKNQSQDPVMNDYWKRTAASLGVPTDTTSGQQQQQPGQATDNTGGTASGSASDMLKAIETKFQSVVAAKGDDAGTYQQLGSSFVAAINKSDQEYAALAQKLQPEETQLQAQITSALTPEKKAQLAQIGAQLDQEKSKLSPADQQLFNQYQSPTTTDAQRQQIHAQLQQDAPKLTQLADQLQQVAGTDTINNMMKLAGDQAQMQDALKGRFLTRFYLADAANTAGDTNTAKAALTSAFQTLPADFQKGFSQQPEVAQLATKLGVDLTKIQPGGTDALAPALQAAAGQQTDAQTAGQPTQPGQQQATGDAAALQAAQQKQQTDAAAVQASLLPEDKGLRPDQIFAAAQMSLSKDGMNDHTKKQFQDAIKVADSTFGPSDVQQTQLLLNVLQSGKKADGTALTDAERGQAHAIVAQELAASQMGNTMRMQYGALLNQNKQYASAEAVFKDNIAKADKLPLDLYQKELQQLATDVKNPNLSRATQADLFTYMQTIQGDGQSKDSGLLYMPITARKQAALFYVGGAESGNGVGIVKPEQSAAMIDDAKAKEKQLYGADLDKNKSWDPTLSNMAQQILPLLPENLRKEKQRADSMWSNVLIDGGVAATALTVAGFAAAALSKNPAFAEIGEGAASGTLNIGTKVGLGALTIGGTIAGRHYLHEAVTGENESWGTSAIHGGAGLLSVAAVMGARGAANKFLFGGASTESALERMAIEKGTAAPLAEGAEAGAVSAGNNLTVGQLAEQFAAKNYVMPEGLRALAANPETAGKLIVEGGAVNSEVLAQSGVNFTNAQAASFTRDMLAAEGHQGVVAKGFSMLRPSNLYESAKGLNPFSTLDLTTATTQQLGLRSFYSGYTSSFAALGTYNTVTAFDGQSIDPKTGKPMSYADAFMANNFSSLSDNTFTQAAFLAMLPAMKDGQIAKNAYTQSAGFLGKGWGTISQPFKPSTFGAIDAGATGSAEYANLARQSFYLGVAPTLYNFNNLQKFGSIGTARQLQSRIDATNAPITDQGAPNPHGLVTNTRVQGGDTQPAAKPQPAAKVENTGNIQDQPVTPPDQQQQQQPGGLADGTPGLGG